MAIQKTDKIWHNGSFITWEDATITSCRMSSLWHLGVRRHSLLRLPPADRPFSAPRAHSPHGRFGQNLPHGPRIHPRRTGRRDAGTGRAQDGACYLRPIVLRGYGEIGRQRLQDPIDVYIACWAWGKYLGEEALAKAWTSASRVGPAWRPIRCPRWPRPARIT